MVKKAKLNLKKEIGSLYGYWLIETNDGYFITDLNKYKNGYKKIFEVNTAFIIGIKNSFATYKELIFYMVK